MYYPIYAVDVLGLGDFVSSFLRIFYGHGGRYCTDLVYY